MSHLTRAQARRLRREARTVELMIRMHCRDLHQPASVGTPLQSGRSSEGRGSLAYGSLCPDCNSLLDYALARVVHCRFGAQKPVCSRCTVHCFRPTMREQVRAAMRYSGPRMSYRHPYLALRHLLDRRNTPNPAL